MIPTHISNSLDRLAMDGVLDYDGYAYLNGSKPRYIGNPPVEPLPPTAYGNDEYINSNSDKPKKSTGKKILIGAGIILACVGIFLGIKNFGAIKTLVQNIDIKGKFTNLINKAKNLFNKKP